MAKDPLIKNHPCIGKRGKAPQKQESRLFCKVRLYKGDTERTCDFTRLSDHLC